MLSRAGTAVARGTVVGGLTVLFPILGLSPIAAAETSVTLSGEMEFRAGLVHNQRRQPGAGRRTEFGETNDAEIQVDARTKLDNGVKFHAHIELNGRDSSDRVDEQYLRITGGFGQLVIGWENSAAYQMQFRPKDAGIGIGDAEDWITNPTGASGSGDSGFEAVRLRFEDNDANKATYYTPRFAGVQFGLSYVPDTFQDTNGPVSSNGVYREGLSLGANLVRDFGSWGVGFAVGYSTWLDGPNDLGERPQGLSLGGRVKVGRVTVAAAYAKFDDLFDRGGADPGNAQDGYGYQAGVAYAAARDAFSLVYHRGVSADETAFSGDDKSDILMLSARRTLAPGVSIAGSAAFAHWHGEIPGPADDNKGWTFVFELLLEF